MNLHRGAESGKAALCGALFLLATGVVGAQRPGGLIPKSSVQPDAALLYTGDVIGYLDPCG